MSAVTPLFAAVLALILLGLSSVVIRQRLSNRVSLGAGDVPQLERAIRAQANFIEYVPLALLLMWFLESLTLSPSLPFWLGTALVVARIAHAFGIFYPKSMMIFRQLGTLATFGVIIVASVAILAFYLPVSI